MCFLPSEMNNKTAPSPPPSNKQTVKQKGEFCFSHKFVTDPSYIVMSLEGVFEGNRMLMNTFQLNIT